jgi:hypothetical protein
MTDPALKDDKYWTELARKALGGDRRAKWEIQDHIGYLVSEELGWMATGGSGEKPWENYRPELVGAFFDPEAMPMTLPVPLATYLAFTCAMIANNSADPRAIFGGTPPPEINEAEERQGEIAMRVRWYVREKGLSVDMASEIVAGEYGSISAGRVRLEARLRALSLFSSSLCEDP